jgi:hypothetical protein
MNSEIVDRLLRSFQSDEDKTTLIARAMIDTYPDIVDRIEEILGEESAQQEMADQAKADALEDYYRDSDK